MQDPIGKCIKDLEFCVCHMTDICLTDKCFLPYLFKIPVGTPTLNRLNANFTVRVTESRNELALITPNKNSQLLQRSMLIPSDPTSSVPWNSKIITSGNVADIYTEFHQIIEPTPWQPTTIWKASRSLSDHKHIKPQCFYPILASISRRQAPLESIISVKKK
ncbi:hypothetical protein KUTeg_010354 [Tegillarca granosa]|uniref:Phlebovirus glycoprotein G2 fusion domain-containing protein n=1 Tax=Tegillarca granosa TaxID=220873 RepID=A0ABQ9F6G6_TEGGR|nr:hypothetical protein KUTeg_010354 [Tegillarca granosa]